MMRPRPGEERNVIAVRRGRPASRASGEGALEGSAGGRSSRPLRGWTNMFSRIVLKNC